MASKPQGHHHLRRDRRDPHAVDVAASAGHRPRRSPTPRSARPRPARPSCICMRAIRRTAGPTRRPRRSRRFLQVIKQRTDCVINITTGGAPTMTIEERVRPAATFKPEVASLNMGSMNFGLFPMLEPLSRSSSTTGSGRYLEDSRDLIFKNTFKDIEYILTTCAENGTRFEFECYDIGHLYNLAPFPRSRAGQAAALRPDRVRHPGRHRPASRGRRCT